MKFNRKQKPVERFNAVLGPIRYSFIAALPTNHACDPVLLWRGPSKFPRPLDLISLLLFLLLHLIFLLRHLGSINGTFIISPSGVFLATFYQTPCRHTAAAANWHPDRVQCQEAKHASIIILSIDEFISEYCNCQPASVALHIL